MPLRRLPAVVWILLPLAVGLLYAAGHALFAADPTAATLAPAEAVLVQRFRDLDTLDRVSFGPRGPKVRPVREVVGEERNVPGLPGVDHEAPVHLVLLPRGNHQDSSMAIFRLEDAGAFEAAFGRTDFLERRLIRHAQHLHIRGGWAAVGPSRDAVRRIGTGTLACADLGEDFAIAADVPRLVEAAMQAAKQYPWRGVLETLGVDPGGTKFVHFPKTGEVRAVIPGAQRVDRLRAAWQTARLWGWMDGGRLRLDLEPRAGPVADALAARATARKMGPLDINTSRGSVAPPRAPGNAEAWLRVPYDYDRPLLAQVLLGCGVRFVEEQDDADLLGGLGAAVPQRFAPFDPGGFVLWASRGIGTGYAWTLGLAAAHGQLPPLGVLLPPLPEGTAQLELPEDAAPVTKGDTTAGRKTPVGTLNRADGVPSGSDAGTYDVLTFGPSAREALESMKNHLGLPQAPVHADPRAAWDPGAGMEVVAEFFVRRTRAQSLLGRALEPGGFLAMLADGDLRGTLSTDGTILRLLVWVERRAG